MHIFLLNYAACSVSTHRHAYFYFFKNMHYNFTAYFTSMNTHNDNTHVHACELHSHYTMQVIAIKLTNQILFIFSILGPRDSLSYGHLFV